MNDLKDLLAMLETLEKKTDWFLGEAYALINAGKWNRFGIDRAIDELRFAIESVDEAHNHLEPEAESADQVEASEVSCSALKNSDPADAAKDQMLAEIRKNFLEWSGGFPPESDYQISVYIDNAAEVEDKEFAREFLRAMMNEESSVEPPMSEVRSITTKTLGDSACRPCAIVEAQSRLSSAFQEESLTLLEFARLFLAYHDNETDDSVTIETLEKAARVAVARSRED